MHNGRKIANKKKKNVAMVRTAKQASDISE